MKKLLFIFLCIFAGFFFAPKLRIFFAENAKVEKHNEVVEKIEECLEAGQWNCAEKNLRILMKEFPNDNNLKMHMAGVLFEQERYQECKDYIENLDFKNSDMEYLWQKSSQLIRENHELGIQNSGHFRLEFEGNPTRLDVMEALTVLEVAYDSLSQLFYFYPEDKIHMVLYKSDDYQGIGPRPDWVGAVYDGKIRFPLGLMHSREVYRPILFHELTHAFVRAMTRAKVPLWMNEGIAQVVDGSRTGISRPSGNAPSLKELTGSFLNESNRGKSELLYWYSEQMVQNLIHNSGKKEPFREFTACLQDMKKLGTDGSLKKHFGMKSEELLEKIR